MERLQNHFLKGMISSASRPRKNRNIVSWLLIESKVSFALANIPEKEMTLHRGPQPLSAHEHPRFRTQKTTGKKLKKFHSDEAGEGRDDEVRAPSPTKNKRYQSPPVANSRRKTSGIIELQEREAQPKESYARSSRKVALKNQNVPRKLVE